MHMPALTTATAKWALGSTVLQAGHNLVLAHIAVAHQQHLQQVIVVLCHLARGIWIPPDMRAGCRLSFTENVYDGVTIVITCDSTRSQL